LPADIFNQPLRRDLIYRLHQYRGNLNRFRTKMTRNRAMTAGSKKKMRPQKKTGSARMGDKRAPHLHKGGKVHGAKPKVYSTYLNSKIKLKALCSLLTAKLA
jgi:large subunit ribosomal protein L4